MMTIIVDVEIDGNNFHLFDDGDPTRKKYPKPRQEKRLKVEVLI